jgi:hypothetical protein
VGFWPVPFAKAFLDHSTQVIVAVLAAPKMGPIRALRTKSWTCATMLQLKQLLDELKS